MAIGAGSIISPKVSGLAINVRGTVFGIVESGAGPYVVLWQDGTRATDISAVTIDEILAADGTVAATYVGRRLRPTSPQGQTAWAYVVAISAYKRNGTDVLLCQSPGGEYFIEVNANQVEVVS